MTALLRLRTLVAYYREPQNYKPDRREGRRAYPPSHGGLKALVAPDRAGRGGRALQNYLSIERLQFKKMKAATKCNHRDGTLWAGPIFDPRWPPAYHLRRLEIELLNLENQPVYSNEQDAFSKLPAKRSRIFV